MSNKSPLKGADPVLVEWAYRAAGDELYQKYVMMQHDRMMKLSEEIRSWDFGSGAQRLINSNGKIPQVEAANIRNDLANKQRKRYREGDNKVKEQVEQEVNRDAADKAMYEKMRKTYGENLKGEMLSNSMFKGANAHIGEELNNLFAGPEKAHLTRKECPDGKEDCDQKGRYGIMMPDYGLMKDANNQKFQIQQEIRGLEALYKTHGTYADGSDLDALYEQLAGVDELIKSNPKIWTSFEEIQDMIKLKDENSINLLQTARDAAWAKGNNVLPEDKHEMNREKARHMFDNVILKAGDIGSLIYDDMCVIGDGADNSFYGHMVSHLMKHKYEELGMTEGEWRQGDLDNSGHLTLEESMAVADNYIGDDPENNPNIQKLLREYHVQNLVDYYELGKEDRRAAYLTQGQGEMKYNEDGSSEIVSRDMQTYGLDPLGETPTETKGLDPNVFSGDDNKYIAPSKRQKEIAKEQEAKTEHTGPSGQTYKVSEDQTSDDQNDEEEDEDEGTEE